VAGGGDAHAVEIETLHGDGAGRAAGGAEAAADAGGLVLEQDAAEGVELRLAVGVELGRGDGKRAGNPVAAFGLAAEFGEAGEADEVLGADVDAAGAGDADLGAEDGVDVAAQAARGLGTGGIFREGVFYDLQRGCARSCGGHGRMGAAQLVPAFAHGVFGG